MIRGRRRWRRIGATALVAVALTAPSLGAERCPGDTDVSLAEALQNRLEAAAAGAALFARGHAVRARLALPSFYLRREYAPAWISGRAPSACARQLVQALHRAPEDGLDGGDYHLAVLDSLLAGPLEAASLADMDLLLTDAWLTFGSHLLQGRVNPTTLEAEWLANRRQADMATALQQALSAGDVSAALAGLRPQQPGYQALRAALARLRDLAEHGGWATLPEGPTLHPGDTDPRVPLLRKRLLVGGDLTGGDRPGDETFDEDLAAAVRGFQRRHGLEPDGNVGRETLAALNVSVEERIAQVEVNMERWRWLPEDLGRRHIRVNIADFHMEVWEDGHVALDMRAVVGQTYRKTPMFSASMTYLVLAPYWNVPPGIAAADKVPAIKKDPGYLAAQHMTLFDQATNQAVDPATVDWASMTGTAFNRRFRIRQDPGPWNALGQVKFMFPNRHNVYLHDTPSRELFSRSTRAFSSGCIRLEKPLALADYLLAGDPAWPPERIRSVIAGGKETTVWLPEPVPVHLLYWTAFLDDDGTVHFRPDIYGRDEAVRRALMADPPGP